MRNIFGGGNRSSSGSTSNKKAAAAAKSISAYGVQHNQQGQSSSRQFIERVRATLPNAHVFKLPPRQSGSGWRGADWQEKVWQGTVKVVERKRDREGVEEEETMILLVDGTNSSIFAVCPVTGRHNPVERCIDSSRYFVLRIENGAGRAMFIGLAFNERNDAFDFNIALEDSRKEKEAEKNARQAAFSRHNNTGKETRVDYSIKAGQKIHIALPKKSSTNEERESPEKLSAAARRRASRRKGTGSRGGTGMLAPSARDTPSRI